MCSVGFHSTMAVPGSAMFKLGSLLQSRAPANNMRCHAVIRRSRNLSHCRAAAGSRDSAPRIPRVGCSSCAAHTLCALRCEAALARLGLPLASTATASAQCRRVASSGSAGCSELPRSFPPTPPPCLPHALRWSAAGLHTSMALWRLDPSSHHRRRPRATGLDGQAHESTEVGGVSES